METRVLLTASVLAALVAGAASSASALDLTGTVRDFRMGNTADGHPDFEASIGGLQTGLVQNALGLDGKPVFAGPDGSGSITSAATFDEWYRDVPGVNVSIPYTLDMTQTGDVFEYASSSFFPIDDQGFGNQGYGHNYAFTYELNTTFGYESAKNLTFDFTGDDDVWVFVNGKLAVDLGGIHGAASGSVDLNAKAADLGLVDGHNYSLDLFFAERHTTESNFRMQTNLALKPVPEPTTMAALGLGALGLLSRRKRA